MSLSYRHSSLFTLVYHKQCRPGCSIGDRCGVCHVEPPPGSPASLLSHAERLKHEDSKPTSRIDRTDSASHADRADRADAAEEEVRPKREESFRHRRHESRRGDSDEERKGIKRQPVRSTRSPTYHEEEDEEVKVAAKKRRTALKSKAESAPEELRFERVAGEEAVAEVHALFGQMFLRQPGAKMEVHLSDVKARTKNLVAWFSSFAPAQQQCVLFFFLLLSSFQ